MTLEEYVEKLWNQEYAHNVRASFVDNLESLQFDLPTTVFKHLGFDPTSCKRISLKCELISSALREAEGFERYRDSRDDFSYLRERVWESANGDYTIAYKEYLEQNANGIREEYEYDVDEDEQNDVTWEQYLIDYDYGKSECQDFIEKELELSESQWAKVIGYSGHDTIVDDVMYSETSYDEQHLFNELLETLGLFEYDPDNDDEDDDDDDSGNWRYNSYGEKIYKGPIDSDFGNIGEYFFRKYINSEYINEIGLYVEDVKYVFNASVYTPQTTLLKTQELKDVLVELKDKVSKIRIEPSLIENHKVTFASTVEDADLKVMKEAKALGLHTALVDDKFENLDIDSKFAPYIDTVYFGNKLGSVQGSIRFPKFNGEFVLLSNRNLKWRLGAMYVEEKDNFAYFVNRCPIYGATTLYIDSFEAGIKASFTIGLYEGETTFDFRLNALTPVRLNFTPIGKNNQWGRPTILNEVVYCVDTSSKVDIDLDSFFENSSYVQKPIFVGLYIEEIKKLILDNDTENYFLRSNVQSTPSVRGFFPSQFDPSQETVLVISEVGVLSSRLCANSRRDVRFDILYIGRFFRNGRDLPFEHLRLNDTNHYVVDSKQIKFYDRRGIYYHNTYFFEYYLDTDYQGSVFYKCIFVNSDVPKGAVAVESTQIHYDLVLDDPTSL